LPTNIQTLGDLIQVKRYEKGFTRGQLAAKMGIAVAKVKAWESNMERPNQQEMTQLKGFFEKEHFSRLLDYELGIDCKFGLSTVPEDEP